MTGTPIWQCKPSSAYKNQHGPALRLFYLQVTLHHQSSPHLTEDNCSQQSPGRCGAANVHQILPRPYQRDRTTDTLLQFDSRQI